MKAPTAWTEKARRKWWLSRMLVLLLTLLCFGLQAVSVYYDVSRHTLMRTADIAVDNSLVLIQLSPAAQEIGLKVGDQLLEIDGREIKTLLQYREALNRHDAGTAVSVQVQRGERTLEMSVLVRAQRLNMLFATFNLIAATFFLMGALVAFRRLEDEAARLFFLTALALGLYYALQNKEAVGLVYVLIFVLTLAPGLTFHFFLTFPRERWLVRRGNPAWWCLLYLPGLILMGMTMYAFSESVAAGTGIWYSSRYENLSNIAFAYLVVSAIFGLISVGYAYATTPHSIEKRQLQWIIWGLSCAIVAGIVDIILTLLGQQGGLLSELVLVGMLPLPVGFAFAILRYRLLDIDLVVNRSVVYGTLTATLMALYLLLVSIVANAVGVAAGSESYTVVVFLSALLIGLLANPVRARLQSVIDQTFFRRQLDYRHALSEWSRELSTSIRFADLAPLLLHEVPRQLMIDRAWLLVLSEDETCLEVMPTLDVIHDQAVGRPAGAQAHAGLPIAAQSAIAMELARPDRAWLLSNDEKEAAAELKGEGMAAARGVPPAWEEAGARVVLPLVSGGRLVGVYLLGCKLSGDVYQSQELDLLRTLANQAAIAIANARLYEEIRAFSQELELKVRERTRELRDFVSAVYHELTAPITAIRGYVELLLTGKGGSLQGKQERYLGIVDRNVQRLMRLVSDLSDVSRIDDGRLTIHPQPIDLRLTVEETLNSLTGIIEEKGLQIAIILTPETTVVLGDPQRVVQILTNLVSNACYYTPAGGQITISASRVDGSVEMRVRDTGIGITREEMAHIFDRFYRSGHPVVQEQPGTGLGLAITKSLIELHGGNLWVDSQVGEGSTFGFTLPVAEVADEP
jgi:signal transduction histidine kinase